MGGGSPPPSLHWWLLALGLCDRLGGPLVLVCPPSGSCALRDRWEPSSGSGFPSRGGVPCCIAWGSPPCALSAHPGCALLDGGSPYPFPPSAATRVRSGQPLGGDPLLCLSVVGFPSHACTWGGFFPPLLPSPPALCSMSPWPSSPASGPVLALTLSDVVLTVRVLPVFGCSASFAVEVFGRVPCSASSRRYLHCLIQRLRSAT